MFSIKLFGARACETCGIKSSKGLSNSGGGDEGALSFYIKT